ncbi:hypothetical protein L596_019213 [Steinernema carpocapsae]|uniref:Uncharacterized protein n=1 Tax=Steinernema carpocapsae TaxID=34508 RepID=A0A4U5MPW4_STECR|nr:hypothetical protein L596_019213 [Steinernema carpocapsae]
MFFVPRPCDASNRCRSHVQFERRSSLLPPQHSSKLLNVFKNKTFNRLMDLEYTGTDSEEFLKIQAKNYNHEAVNLYGNWPESTKEVILKLLFKT